ADLKPLPVERAGLDGGAVVIRHKLVLVIAAADAHAFVRKCQRPGLVAGSLEIARPAIERDGKFRRGKARARDDRLEIAGQQSLGLAQASDAHRLKVLLEKSASYLGILRLQDSSLAADAGQPFALVAASRFE